MAVRLGKVAGAPHRSFPPNHPSRSSSGHVQAGIRAFARELSAPHRQNDLTACLPTHADDAAPQAAAPQAKKTRGRRLTIRLDTTNLGTELPDFVIAASSTVMDLKQFIFNKTDGEVDVNRMYMYTTDSNMTRTELDERGADGGGLLLAYNGISLDNDVNIVTLQLESTELASKRADSKRITPVPRCALAVYEELGIPPPSLGAGAGGADEVVQGMVSEAAANAAYRRAVKDRPKTPRKTREGAKAGGGGGGGGDDDKEKKTNATYSPWSEEETRVIVDYLIKAGMHHGCWAAISKEIGNKDDGQPKRSGVQVKDRWRNLTLAADRTDTGKMRNPVPADILMRVREIRQNCGNTTPRTASKNKGGKMTAAQREAEKADKDAKAAAAAATTAGAAAAAAGVAVASVDEAPDAQGGA